MCILTIKIFMMTKNLIYMVGFSMSNLSFFTNYLKIDENSRFFQIFCSKFKVFPDFFSLNRQIPGFSKFPDKLTTMKP